ncbi:hypothetical protein B0A55_04892 [Friedmanniomyces simplex]|uniref:FAD-binding domain-containing protein n=1 Tax=Friedmanniomyces simplex TaxID=329884 RepID=A0A4U0XH99_9PEZI|nr:hypothetical protein B0A55_04892 [Friedmanniomyces simplex]
MGSANDLSLDIKVIGAGIAGLACAFALSRKGHKVTVYERNSKLYEYGSGLQMSPNASRIIYQWGLQEHFLKVVNQPDVMTVRRYSDDKVIGEIPHNPMSEWEFGSPYWQIYRPDFQNILAKAALEEGVEIRFGHAVTSIDAERGTMSLDDGTQLEADLIIAADGIRSRARSAISPVQAESYNEACFRAVVPKARMLQDPETARLMAGDFSMVWVGPGAAVLGYALAGGELYNALLSIPRSSHTELGRWNQPGDLDEVRSHLKDFCTPVKKVWNLVDDCAKWELGDVPKLDSYVSQSGKFVLVGDAAHAIIPHAGQGGAMALEDAAVLAEFLDPKTLLDRNKMPVRMQAYHNFRQPRIESIRRTAYGDAKMFTLPNGLEQEQRDKLWAGMTAKWKAAYEQLGEAAFKRQVEADPHAADFRSPDDRAYLYGYDAAVEARELTPRSQNAHMTEPAKKPTKATTAPNTQPTLSIWLGTAPNPELIDKHTLAQAVNHAYHYVQPTLDRANVLCEELMLPVTGLLDFDVRFIYPSEPVTHQRYAIPIIPMRNVVWMDLASKEELSALLVALAVTKTIAERTALQLEFRAMHGRKVRAAAARAEGDAQMAPTATATAIDGK